MKNAMKSNKFEETASLQSGRVLSMTKKNSTNTNGLTNYVITNHGPQSRVVQARRVVIDSRMKSSASLFIIIIIRLSMCHLALICSDLFRLIRTCSNLFGSVRTYLDLFELARNYSDLFGLIQTCSDLLEICSDLFRLISNLLRLIRTCLDLFGLVRTCSNLFGFVRTV